MFVIIDPSSHGHTDQNSRQINAGDCKNNVFQIIIYIRSLINCGTVYIFPYPPPFQVHFWASVVSTHCQATYIQTAVLIENMIDRTMGTRRVHGIRFREQSGDSPDNNGTSSSERERVVMRVGSRGMETMVRVVTELKDGETFCDVGQSAILMLCTART